MTTLFRDFINNNNLITIYEKLERFTRMHHLELSQPQYYYQNNKEFIYELEKMLNNKKEDILLNLEKNFIIEKIEIKNKTLVNVFNESIEFLLKLKTKNNDLNLCFYYNEAMKEIQISNFNIPNKNCEKAFWRFYPGDSYSLFIPISDGNDNTNNIKDTYRDVDYLEFSISKNYSKDSHKDKNNQFYLINKNYERVFELSNNKVISNILNDKEDVYKTHEFCKIITSIIDIDEDIVNKLIFGYKENYNDIIDLISINYDIKINREFEKFYIDTSNYYGQKLSLKENNSIINKL